jgi:hypothetical protein
MHLTTHTPVPILRKREGLSSNNLDPVVVNKLAVLLHGTMERLDPSQDELWEDLAHSGQEFFRECVREILWALLDEPAKVLV